MAGGNFGGGTGLVDDPYIVEDALDFFSVGDSSANKIYYKQVADIDFSGKQRSSNQVLYGEYDGRGHKLKNFTVNSGEYSNTFFISSLYGAIRNLEIDSSCSLVDNRVSVSNSLLSVGGFAANAYSDSLLINCINRANMQSSRRISGIAGMPGDHSNNSYTATILYCQNHGNITSTSSDACGIYLGLGPTLIDGCLNTGRISGRDSAGICNGNKYTYNCKNEGAVYGSYSAAGIFTAKSNNRQGPATIENCINTGILSSDRSAGGIVHSSYSAYSHNIKSCFALNEKIIAKTSSPVHGQFQRICGGTTIFSSIIISDSYALDTMVIVNE